MGKHQKGVTLVITFLIMTTMLGITLSLSSILFSKIHIMMNVEDAILAFYAADGGIEEITYIDKKQIPAGANRGLCFMKQICDDSQNCSNFTETNLATDGTDGCGTDTFDCKNCEVSYKTTFGNTTYNIKAKVIPDDNNPNISLFFINSKGTHQSSNRSIEGFSQLSQ